ncbi:protoglobin domain-containing protein [Thermoflavifilum thermophilum]|uniref:Protoglobin n=1 Tax=Thermoflavifilum thermophilum TaxID=1393122 RepID=A0A1I7NC60_9BACT|nr:protoglobin domain-containing protein [Thermoflavifilum thermophilum]SFV32239.1 Protoglobin [Thermoflavifilum thermophilum]
MANTFIPGYTYGQVPEAPFSMHDFELLKQTVMFTEKDAEYLRKAGEILHDQVNEILDLWYGFVGQHPHLLAYFAKDGKVDSSYLQAVRKRFGQWIHDLCEKPFDQDWLNYQYEIGLRHHATKKNLTDHAQAAPLIHYRYMVAFIYPITATIRAFLARKGHPAELVEQMHQAWFKAVVLTVVLWTYPYVKQGEF